MPSFYAHYRFGHAVLHRLPVGLQQELFRHATLFDLGLWGPDLFFEENPKEAASSSIGYQLHTKPAHHFLTFAREQAAHSSPELLCYLYGFICHFVLDHTCNPYLLDKSKARRFSYNELALSFDLFLAVQDRRTTLPALQVRPATAALLAPLFPHIRPSHLLKKLRYTPKLPKPTSFPLTSPTLAQYHTHLLTLYENAVSTAVRLIVSYQASCRDQLPLSKEFRQTFGLPGQHL